MKKLLSATFAVICVGATLALAAGPKITICHIPPGNPENAHEITVDDNSVKLIAHLKHGDTIGECPSQPD